MQSRLQAFLKKNNYFFIFWNDDFTVIVSHMLAKCITKLLLFHFDYFYRMEIEAEMLFQFFNVGIVIGLAPSSEWDRWYGYIWLLVKGAPGSC